MALTSVCPVYGIPRKRTQNHKTENMAYFPRALIFLEGT